MLRLRSAFPRLASGWHALVLAVAATATTIAGCGGGVGVGGTGAYASGPISGFGSVIVNGIRFDDSNAPITTEDGSSLDRTSLGLGMFAEIDSGPIGGTAAEPTAAATKIRISSQLVGPVAAKTADTLTLVDQTVQVTATTVYDSSIAAGLSAITAGDVLEVYGFFDANAGRLIATRVERKTSTPSKWKVRGVVANLTPTSFTIGGGTFTYSGTPAGLANGAYVAVEVQPAATGPWVVTSVGEGQRKLPELDRVELKGSITAFTSAASFSVNGQPVDASGVTIAGLGLGVRVEVRGAVTGGVLRASRIEIEDSGSGGGGSGGGGGGGTVGAFEFKGELSSLSAGTTPKTFVVNSNGANYTIDYTNAVVTGTLANGVKVQVKANPTATANTFAATEVKVDN